jgi:hypothetical protein
MMGRKMNPRILLGCYGNLVLKENWALWDVWSQSMVSWVWWYFGMWFMQWCIARAWVGDPSRAVSRICKYNT